MPEKINVLFVCLGNICRSTMAEGIFQSVAKKEPYAGYFGKIDSCGTGELSPLLSLARGGPGEGDGIELRLTGTAGYHIGDPPDDRTMMTLQENGIKNYVHRGRQVRPLLPPLLIGPLPTFSYI